MAGAIVAGVVAGPSAWPDWVRRITRVGGNAMTAPGVLSIGAIAYRAGVPMPQASMIQWGSTAVVAGVALYAWLRRPPDVAIVVTAVASVIVSPIVWNHYAVIILLPVALLLDRRHWWAAALPLLTWLPSDAVYPIVFAIRPARPNRPASGGSELDERRRLLTLSTTVGPGPTRLRSANASGPGRALGAQARTPTPRSRR